MYASVKIDIAAPLATVFAVLRDPQKRKGWMAGLMETRQTSGKEGAVNSTFVDIVSGREFNGTILANSFPTHFSIQMENPQITVIYDWELTPQPSGTRLVFSNKTKTRKFVLRLFAPFTTSAIRRIMKRQAKRIKLLAESR
ncbi:MAG TPA: SRPBCC family protein [Tepidisphaeraceae bacterium]|nr:SRPBCC family protein [Tepidisphaeraceae bacterium]